MSQLIFMTADLLNSHSSSKEEKQVGRCWKKASTNLLNPSEPSFDVKSPGRSGNGPECSDVPQAKYKKRTWHVYPQPLRTVSLRSAAAPEPAAEV